MVGSTAPEYWLLQSLIKNAKMFREQKIKEISKKLKTVLSRTISKADENRGNEGEGKTGEGEK